jgi:hypothetical protein
LRPGNAGRGLPRLIVTVAVALGVLGVGGSVASAAPDPNYCGPGKPATQPCRGCPGDPQGPCSPFEDSGRVDNGQRCCDSACVNFRSNPSGLYEDYIWVYGWSYHNRRTGADYRQSYVGGKGGTVGPWTPRGRYHTAACS